MNSSNLHHMFPSDIYRDRRKILRKSLDSGLILLLGNDEAPMNYTDNTYRFRQDSSFLYYFGLQRPGLVGVLDIDAGEDILFGREYSVEDIVWMGAQESLDALAFRSAIENVRDLDSLASMIKQARKSNRSIHYLSPYRASNQIKLSTLVEIDIAAVSKHWSLPLVRAIIAQREIKSDQEIKLLHRTVDVSVDMHMAAMQFAQPGMTEAEVAAEVHKVALAAGGDIAFPIIATINGQNLHNHFHGNTIKESDLFLIDAGFENPMGYAGDLSSTFPVSRRFSSRQKDIYQITLAAHQAAIDALGLGIPFRDAHLAASQTIFDGLKSLNITQGNTEDAIESGAHALFFPCGTGHMMGLDVHDMEDLGEVWVGYDGKPKSEQFGLKSLRLAKPLKIGFVFTIEPGVYFIPELMDQWQSKNECAEFINWSNVHPYRDFGGIRNEEDFVMTKDGARLLGKPKPKTIAQIEHFRENAI